MKLHPRIETEETVEFQQALLEKAKETKLNKIDFTKRYDVFKQSAKKRNPYGLPDKGSIIMRAFPFVIGNPEDGVALYFYTTDEWFHCSIIKKCTKYKKYIKVETANSIYKLYPWK